MHLGWRAHMAEQWVASNGRCTYCGRDVLHDRLGFASQCGDHLLPRRHYAAYADDERNEILCCSLCNSVKGHFDPLVEGEDPDTMLGPEKHAVVQRARDYILQQRQEIWDPQWLATREAVFGFHFPLP